MLSFNTQITIIYKTAPSFGLAVIVVLIFLSSLASSIQAQEIKISTKPKITNETKIPSKPKIAQEIKIPIKPINLGESDFNKEQLKAFISGDADTMISGLIANPKLYASSIQSSFFAQKSNAITGKFLLGNYTKIPMKYQIVCLVNYKQVKFKFNGKWSNSHIVNLKTKSHKIYPIELKALPEGAHDFLLVAILKNKKIVDKNQDFQENANFSVISKRANIYIGKAKFPRVKYRKDILTKPNKDSETRVVINGESSVTNFTAKQQSKTRNTHKYIHISNNNEVDNNAVAILFSDGKQIEFEKNSSTVFFKQQKKAINLIPVTLKSTQQAHQLLSIVVSNPYEIIEPIPGKFTKALLLVRISNTVLDNE